MRARAAAFALLFVVPLSTAVAQRGGGMGGGMGRGGGGMGGRGGRGGSGQQAARFPSASDLKKYNPAELLADKKKNLSLTDEQVTTLKALKETITDRNAVFLAHYDSVQKTYKPDALQGPYGLDEDTRDKIKLLRTLVDSAQTRRLLDVTESLAIVTDPAARRIAAEFLVKQEEEYRSKLMPQRAGGFGGRGMPEDR